MQQFIDCGKIIKEYADIFLVGSGVTHSLILIKYFLKVINMSKYTELVSEIAKPIVSSLGLNLVNVEYVKEGSDWVLRVYIENKDGELSIDYCENVSKMLSNELDKKNFIKNSYILEVSSPGIERPLKTPEDYNNFTGEKVIIKTYATVDGRKEFMGKLMGLKDDIVIIKQKGPKGVVKIPLAKIAHAYLTIDF